MKEKSSIGVIYVATGKKKLFAEEVKVSIRSLLQKTNVGVTLFVDDELSNDFSELEHSVNVVQLEKPQYSFYDKLQAIEKSPYYKTLFLDTDTYICDDISDIFEMLDVFDVAIALDPSSWKSYHSPGYSAKYDVPEFFPEFNSGVFAFKRNENFRRFFEVWKKLYKENNTSLDQPTLRVALYHSSIRICPLIPEYNLRITGGAVCLQAGAKIIHARLEEAKLKKIAKKLNDPLLKGHRVVFHPSIGFLMSFRLFFMHLLKRILRFFRF